jgi:uncharacterized protein
MQVTHNEAMSRFEALVDGQTSVCVYRRSGNVVAFTHTEVPMAQEGRGIAAAMVRAALAWAREQGLKVQPLCSYVALYLRRHPEQADLLA